MSVHLSRAFGSGDSPGQEAELASRPFLLPAICHHRPPGGCSLPGPLPRVLGAGGGEARRRVRGPGLGGWDGLPLPALSSCFGGQPGVTGETVVGGWHADGWWAVGSFGRGLCPLPPPLLLALPPHGHGLASRAGGRGRGQTEACDFLEAAACCRRNSLVRLVWAVPGNCPPGRMTLSRRPVAPPPGEAPSPPLGERLVCLLAHESSKPLSSLESGGRLHCVPGDTRFPRLYSIHRS